MGGTVDYFSDRRGARSRVMGVNEGMSRREEMVVDPLFMDGALKFFLPNAVGMLGVSASTFIRTW